MQIDSDKIQAAVISEATDQIISEFGWRDVVSEAVERRIDKIFAETAERKVHEAVERAIDEGFDREFYKSDRFGMAEGQPTSVRKELERLISEYWQERVDGRTGKPTDSAHRSVTRAEWMMVKICGEDFHKGVRQEVINVTAQLKDSLREELRRWVDATLGELFKVRTNVDKAEGRHYG